VLCDTLFLSSDEFEGVMLIQLSILVLAMAASGCATIFNGSSQAVTFDSSPNGASIFVNGVEVGKTPLSMLMRRSRTTMILAKKDGYEDQHLALQTATSGNFWMNIAMWGFVGTTVDYFSDAMIEYSPNQYYIRLNRIPLLQSQAGVVGVDSGAYKRFEPEGISTEARVKAYILRSDQNLRADISRGRGEYLSSLNLLLRLPESGQTLKRLRAIAARNREAPSFADAILSEYPAK
jgi:hypothetical protein